jgi:hypothetical protein
VTYARGPNPRMGGKREATPELTAFSRPKFFGVAPAHHAGSVIVFCPRAYKDVSNPESRTVSIPNLERSSHRWQY